MLFLKNIVVAAVLGSCAWAAQAQVVSNLDYSLALSDAPMDGHFYSASPCNFGSRDNRYRTMTVQVTAAGDYEFYDRGYLDDLGEDGGIGIYSGTFDPTDLAASCVASIDDTYTVTLAAGTYTLVLSSWSGVQGGEGDIPGNFYYTITGPGPFGTPAPVPQQVTAVPTMSEWGIMLLGLGAAGLGMRRLRRKA